MTQATDEVDLHEVDLVREVNDPVVRLNVRNGGTGATRHGLLTLTVDHSRT